MNVLLHALGNAATVVIFALLFFFAVRAMFRSVFRGDRHKHGA